MKLRAFGTAFVLDSTFHEKDAAKQAGFWWHPASPLPPEGVPGFVDTRRFCRDNCEGCAQGIGRTWWTPKPELAALLVEFADQECRDRLAAITGSMEASRATDVEIDVPSPEGFSYMGFQRAGIAYALARKGTLIADEMGLGKTIQALGVVNASPDTTSVLVLCPASLRLNWYREARRWLVRPFQMHVVNDQRPVGEWARLVICNYDRLRQPQILQSLASREWDVVIADECHYLKNPTAQRTIAVLGQRAGKCKACSGRGNRMDTSVRSETRFTTIPCEKCRGTGKIEEKSGIASRATSRSLFLTGTPILNRPMEIQPIVAMLAPQEFWDAGKFWYRYVGKNNGAIRIKGRLEELQGRLRATCMVRRLKADVLKDLPPKRRQIVVLPSDDLLDLISKERDAADEGALRKAELAIEAATAKASGDQHAYQEAVANLRDGGSVAFAEISKVRHETALAKVPQVIEHLDSLIEGGVPKLVVFAHHHDVISKIATHYGKRCVVLTGDTKMEDRDRAVRSFQEGPVEVFVGSITAAGVGLTLTAASTVVFAELDWVPGNVTQAEDRCHRIGQEGSVLVQHLVLDGSLDARMAQTIVEKQEMMDRALDSREKIQAPPAPTTQPVQVSTPKAGHIEERAVSNGTAILRALRELAQRCDGAHRVDGSGFNKYDTDFGKSLATRTALSPKQLNAAFHLVNKYRRQLDEGLLAECGIGGKE